MKRRRHTPEQIVRKLREAERLLGEGQTIAEAAKQVEISEQTYHRWRNQYGGMKADDAKRLRELERENARLKRIVADKELEIDALKPESTDRSLKGRAAGLAESSAGVAAFAGRCRGRTGARSRRSARLGGAEGAGARVREACAGMLARASEPGRAVSGRQAGSGSARNRARAAAHWPAQGQRFGRCRVQRRAEWVSRPARAK